jgi:8-oxo-dGTP pyrophosphatase MutT (NUDIX family)
MQEIDRFIDFIQNRNYKEYLEKGDEHLMNKKPNARWAAVLIGLIHVGEDFLIPMIQKPSREKVHGGQMAFPGGRMEMEDEDLEVTALRETWEEIGIKDKDVKIIGSGPLLDVFASNHLVKPYYGIIKLEAPVKYKTNPDEVAKLIEVPLSSLLDVKTHTDHYIEKYRIKVKAYQYENNTIWGASGKMLEHFLECWTKAVEKQ